MAQEKANAEKTAKEKTKTEKIEKTNKNEFVEIEFVGIANGKIFDTNIKKEAEKINLKIEAKPLVVCVGQDMLVKGFDKELEGKELEKEYKIKLSPEEAFGKRNPSLIKIIPLNIFKEKDINPAPGLILNLDGLLARIITVSGGRVITDFNNPLAGKEIEYEFTIKRKVTDEKEKINALQDFFFRKRFDFKVEEKKIIFEKNAKTSLQDFKEKFKEILRKDVEVEEEKEKAEGKKKEEVGEEKKEKKEKERKERAGEKKEIRRKENKDGREESKQNKEEAQQRK